jgi:hypothetical protein
MNEDVGPYNEKNELQRMANAIIRQKLPVNDQLARLAWNISTDFISDFTKQEELFIEIINLLKKARSKR